MNFLIFTGDDGEQQFINMDKVVMIDKTLKGSRLLFDFEVYGDFAYTDVSEKPKEIMLRL